MVGLRPLSAVRIAMEHPTGALPRTPLPASRDFPSRGNEKYGEGKQRVIYFTYHFGVFPLWWLAPPPCPVGSMSLDSQSPTAPYESSSFATPAVRWGGKGKRLNGQARRLTLPHLEVLCRTSTGDYKAPLCCELLMKGLLFRALLSHRSAGGRWCRKAPKGGKPPEVADRRNAYHAI